jgi:hypothetical protein
MVFVMRMRTRRRRRLVRFCVPIATAVVVSVTAWQGPAFAGDPGAAREQLKIGYQLSQEGKCDEALPHLVESLRLDPKAITLINLADCEEKTGHLADAMAHWGDARSRAQSEGAKPIEDEAEKRAAALQPRLPRLTIVLVATAPKDATVERDGVALGPPSLGIPLPVDPGAHTLVVKAKGKPDGTTQVTIAEGESKRVEVDIGGGGSTAPPPITTTPPPQPDKPKGGMSPLVYIGFGVAAVGAGVGSVTGIMALGKASDVDAACPDLRCTDPKSIEERDSGRTLGWVSTISFAVAGAGAAVGVYGLLFANKGKTDPKVDPSVGVSFSPMGAALSGRF